MDTYTETLKDVMAKEYIKVLVIEPGKAPYVKDIDSGLKSLQNEVAGRIEAIYPFEDPVAVICNEEGKLNGLPLNRALIDDNSGEIYDIVAVMVEICSCRTIGAPLTIDFEAVSGISRDGDFCVLRKLFKTEIFFEEDKRVVFCSG